MTKSPLGLSGDEYWNVPYAKIDETIGAFPNAPRLIADVPPRIDLRSTRTLPMIVSLFDSHYHHWLFSHTRCGRAVAVNPDSGEIRIGVLEPQDGPPEEFDASHVPEVGDFGTTFEVALRERLSLPWQPGRWIVRVIVHDRVSEPVQTELVGTASSSTGQMEHSAPSEAAPWLSFPSTTATTAARSALSIHAPAVVDPATDPRARVSVRFTLPHEEKQLGAGQESLAVPVHIWFTGFLVPGGTLLTVHAPIKPPPSTAAGGKPMVSGAFDLHLAALASQGLDLREQDYQVYAFAGEHMAGPTKIQLGAKSHLPPPPEFEVPQLP